MSAPADAGSLTLAAPVLPTLYALVLSCAYLSGRQHTTARDAARPAPTVLAAATVAACVAIGCAALLQFRVPQLLVALRRDAGAIAAGQWWRLVTSLIVQDEGPAGTVSNLAALLLVGSVAEQLYGIRRWLSIFLAGGIATQFVALRWQPIGAGTSVAIFSLAGAVCVLVIAGRPRRAAGVLAWTALGAAATLLVLRDVHGAAAACGVILGACFTPRRAAPLAR